MSLSDVTPVLVLRRYRRYASASFTPLLFGLVPAEMEVGVKYLEIFQAEFESACKHSGEQLGDCLVGMPSLFNKNICSLVAFDTAPRSVQCRFSFV